MPKKKYSELRTVTIKITRETRKLLQKLKNHYSETYDYVITRLIKNFEVKNNGKL